VCASVLASEGVGRSTKACWIAARFGVLQVIKVLCDEFQGILISGLFKAAGTAIVFVFAIVIWFSEVFAE
jgi:hypothetical protein